MDGIVKAPFLLYTKDKSLKHRQERSKLINSGNSLKAARVLEEYGVCHWEKHFSLVTPKDFMEKFGRKRIFEGSLRELVEMSVQEETVCAVEKIA